MTSDMHVLYTRHTQETIILNVKLILYFWCDVMSKLDSYLGK